MRRISLFRDKEDYIKTLTNDDVVNVIGTKDYGKTTSTLKYLNRDNYRDIFTWDFWRIGKL